MKDFFIQLVGVCTVKQAITFLEKNTIYESLATYLKYCVCKQLSH